MVAHDIYHGYMAFLRVMDIGQGIAQARTQVQQGRGGLARHAGIPVGSAAEHAFEQAQYTTHSIDLIQGSHKMHLRCTRVGKTHVDIIINQCSE